MTRRRVDKVRDWATLDKLTTVADLLFKITALVAALAAANFFYYQPDVKLDTTAQAFIDIAAVRTAYTSENERVPSIVTRAAEEYNRLNARDLRAGHNTTPALHPATQLCREMRREVMRVFPDADCASPRPVLGRGRTYERLLLVYNARRERPLSVTELRDAIARMRTAEFLRARCAITNAGNAKAVNVQIRASDGFFLPNNAVNGPFTLEPNPGDPVHRTFMSSPGSFEEDPELEFGVDWSRAGLTDTGPATLVATLLLVAFVLVLLNDFLKSIREEREAEAKAAREDAERP